MAPLRALSLQLGEKLLSKNKKVISDCSPSQVVHEKAPGLPPAVFSADYEDFIRKT